MQQLTVRLHSTIAIDDCPIPVLSEYRNFTTSERNRKLEQNRHQWQWLGKQINLIL